MIVTLDRNALATLDAWITEQPAGLIVEVQARVRRGMRIDTVCILSTSPADTKFTDLPASVIEDTAAVLTPHLDALEPGDCLELTAKRAALATRVADQLTAGASIGHQYDPRDGGALGFWRQADGVFCRGDINVDTGARHAFASFPDRGAFISWLAAQSDRTMFDGEFELTREELERSANKGDIS